MVYAPFDEDYGYVDAGGVSGVQAGNHGDRFRAARSSSCVDGIERVRLRDRTHAPLAAAINRLAADRSLAERLGRAGQSLVAQTIGWDGVIEQLVG